MRRCRVDSDSALRCVGHRAGVAGFTIIELITTLIILGILATVAMGRMDFSSLFQQRGVADKLKAGLEFARKSAVAKRRSVCVGVSGGSVTFTVDTAAPESAVHGCPGGSPLVLPAPDKDCGGAANTLCSRSNATIALVSGGSPFTFNAEGAASTTAVFSVTGQSNITVESGTGYVH
jgi:MSHA pilin protein MshC